MHCSRAGSASRVNTATVSPTPRTAREILLLVAILGLAAIVRAAGLGRESFWFDEAAAAFLANAPVQDILSGAAHDAGNPQGFWLLGHFWQAIAGHSDTALRTLPLLLGLCGVIALHDLGRQLGGPALGLLAAALLTVNPGHIYLSQEFRAYTLLFLAVTVLLSGTTRFDRDGGWPSLAMYVLAAVAGMYSHYYTALVVMAANLWMLRRWRDGRVFFTWCIAQVLVLLLVLPVIHEAAVHATARAGASGGGASSELHLAATPLTLLFGRTLAWKADGRMALAIALVAATALLVATFWLSCRRTLRQRGLLVIAAVAPLLLAATLAFGADMQSWDDRKALAILAPVLLLVAHGLLAARPALRNLLLLLIATLSCGAWLRYLHVDNRDDWRGACRLLRTEALAGDALLVTPDYELASIDRYLPGGGGASVLQVRYGYASADGEYLTLGRLELLHHGKRLPEALRAARRLWIINNRVMPDGLSAAPLAALGLSDATPVRSVRLARDLELQLFESAPHP